jgi:hypothetical protein
MYFYMCARRDVLVIIFLTNDLFLSVESFLKINYYINRNSNITKYHDKNNYYIIIKYYFIYYDNNKYNNNTNTYSKNKNFIITRPTQKRITSYVLRHNKVKN